MTTTIPTPTPVVGWDANRNTWLAARRNGIGASDVAAILGFSTYRTPWQVWAEKLNVRRPEDQPSEAADLGNALEPWLLDQATIILGQPVTNTPHQLYAHPDYPWRMCSPDGQTVDGTVGVEAKTAGLASGFGPPKGWDDGGIPLGYELQCRWITHVMGWERIEIVALVANRGLLRRTILRDLAVEADLTAQVTDWWQRHIVNQAEPPFAPTDQTVLGEMHPTTGGGVVDLSDTNALELWFAYRDARDREKAARADKDIAAAGLKRLLGANQFGTVDGHLICSWSERPGHIDWPRIIADLANDSNTPNLELYRKPAIRTLTVKE